MWLLPSSVSAGAVAVIAIALAPHATAIQGGSDELNSYLEAHPIPTESAVPVTISNTTIAPELVDLVLSDCPAGCNETGSSSGNWTLYSQLGRLSRCNHTMLLDFTIFSSLRNDPIVRACTASDTTSAINTSNTTNEESCLPEGSLTQIQASVQLAFNDTGTSATLEDFEAASTQLATPFSQQDSNCTDITSFTYSKSVTVGLFAGSAVRAIAASVLPQLIAKIKSTGFSSSVVAQLCDADGRTSRHSFGIVVSGDRDVSFVQDAVATWASGGCIVSYDRAEAWKEITLSVPTLLSNSTVGNSTGGSANNTARTIPLTPRRLNSLHRRASCSTIQVVSGDSCEYSWQSLLR